jgi:hypothetical protein
MNYSDAPVAGTPRTFVACGARAAEELLLQHLKNMLPKGMQDIHRLTLPIILVVPSWSLRDHICSVLVHRFGRSIAGVSVHTLHQLASEILHRTGVAPPAGGSLFPILVRRHAREQKELRDGLEHLEDGYAGVVSTVTDLIEAGFQAVHAGALKEKLAEIASKSLVKSEVRRASAIVRVAECTERAMNELGIGVTATLLVLAKTQLELDPDGTLPARAVLIYGFADATGVAADLIEALMRYRGAWAYLDHTPDPAAPEQSDSGIAFTKRFSARLEQIATPEPLEDIEIPAPRLTLLKAPGMHAEIRAVASRILDLLNHGVSPERIAVVARTLTSYRIPLRMHFNRLGIPFSALETLAPHGDLGRRVHALMDVMIHRMSVQVDRWLDVVCATRLASFLRKQNPSEEVIRSDLRLAFRALGVIRLNDLTKASLYTHADSHEDFPLPLRRGLSAETEEDEEVIKPRAYRRRLPNAALRNANEAVTSMRMCLDNWSDKLAFRSHLERLHDLLILELGWSSGDPGTTEVFNTLNGLEDDVPGDFELSYEEFALLVTKALSDMRTAALGGKGGGVQVLNVMEARARTFEHLFLIGLNRDVFPRIVREDPLMPDYLRRGLLTLLPDMPLKNYGFDEEHFLFAELLSASPHVTLSWQTVDERGKIRPASPLLERLRLAHEGIELKSVPTLYTRPAGVASPDEEEERPPHEYAVLAALYESRASLSRIFPIALAHTMEGSMESDRAAQGELLAVARMAVLSELDPDRGTPQGRSQANALGPYFGFIGPVGNRADPRLGDLYITTLERMAACPWQVFVQNLLRIEPTPDPMEALPGVDAPLLGAMVHAVLERIVQHALTEMPERLEDARGKGPQAVTWPDPNSLTQIVEEEAERLARERGIDSLALARVLAEEALPYLETACGIDWPQNTAKVAVLGAELAGELWVEDDTENPRHILFKADRADLEDGLLRLTDYKTGRPISNAKTQQTRLDHFFRAVRKGERLQAVAYVVSAGSNFAEGRYLFLKPGIAEASRTFSVNSDDRNFVDAFMDVTKLLLRAIDRGAFSPRLVEPKGRNEPSRCSYCPVAQACLRGDSETRARLVRWIQHKTSHPGKGSKLTPQEQTLLEVWQLWGE